MNNKRFILIVLLRYLASILCYFLLPLFYIILTPLTLYPVFFITKIIYGASLQGNLLIIGPYTIEFVKACIAGSAFLLLLIINLITPLGLKKRILVFIFGSLLLLLFNIARIIILIILLVNNSATFDITHKLFWYMLSTLFVVAIWLISIKVFRIKTIPVYSDIMKIIKISNMPKK